MIERDRIRLPALKPVPPVYPQHTHLILLPAALLPIVEDVVPCVILRQQQRLLHHLPPPHKEQQQQEDDWDGAAESVGTCPPHPMVSAAPRHPQLTQQGQESAQGSEDEGQAGGSLCSLGTALRRPLAVTDARGDHGELGFARLVKQPQVHAVDIRLQRCHQPQGDRVTYVEMGVLLGDTLVTAPPALR